MKTTIRQLQLTFIVFLTFLSIYANADIRYITDVAYVPLRSGAGNDYRIIHYGLKSGLKLNILDYPNGEWAQVQTPSGLEGWVRKQYLTSNPIARVQLEKAQRDLLVTKQELEKLKKEFTRLRDAHTQLTGSAKISQNEKVAIENKYNELKKLSQRAVELSRSYDELQKKYLLLETENNNHRAQRDRLMEDKTIRQWLFGAGLIFTGMILMIVLPALKPKKRHSEWA